MDGASEEFCTALAAPDGLVDGKGVRIPGLSGGDIKHTASSGQPGKGSMLPVQVASVMALGVAETAAAGQDETWAAPWG